MMKSKGLVNLLFNMIFVIVLIGYFTYGASAQQQEKRTKPPVVVIEIVLPSPTPPGVPVPYPNTRVKYTPNTRNPQSIVQGKSMNFILTGDELEKIGSVQVISRGSRTNLFEAKLEPIQRGKRTMPQRRITVTPKRPLPAGTIYRIDFKTDQKSKVIYSEEFISSK